MQRDEEQSKIQAENQIQIVDYEPQYQQCFRDLNVEWISKYFKMEESDYLALDNPKGHCNPFKEFLCSPTLAKEE